MEIRLPYGRSFVTATLPDHVQIDTINPSIVPAAENPLKVVQTALDNLLGRVD
jgi:hypothetical protein